MSDFSDEETKFLEKNFPAGEYSICSIMVRNDELERFLAHLKGSGCNLCVMPNAKAMMDFVNIEKDGSEQ